MRGLGPTVAAVLLLAACGDDETCPPVPSPPEPMSAPRARRLAPEIETGLALSTTLIRGDCRPSSVSAPSSVDECGRPASPCAVERAPLLVWVVETNVSVPIGATCSEGSPVASLARLAVRSSTASAAGELVLSLDPGFYSVFLAGEGDRCAPCGLADQARCRVEVSPRQVAVRQLVLDRATR